MADEQNKTAEESTEQESNLDDMSHDDLIEKAFASVPAMDDYDDDSDDESEEVEEAEEAVDDTEEVDDEPEDDESDDEPETTKGEGDDKGFNKALQKEQRKRAELERKYDEQSAMLKSAVDTLNELKEQITSQGGKATPEQKEELNQQAEDISDLLSGLDDDDVIDAGQMKKIIAGIKSPKADTTELEAVRAELKELKESLSRPVADLSAREQQRAFSARLRSIDPRLAGHEADVSKAFWEQASELDFDLAQIASSADPIHRRFYAEQEQQLLDKAVSSILERLPKNNGKAKPKGGKKPSAMPDQSKTGIDAVESGASVASTQSKDLDDLSTDELILKAFGGKR